MKCYARISRACRKNQARAKPFFRSARMTITELFRKEKKGIGTLLLKLSHYASDLGDTDPRSVLRPNQLVLEAGLGLRQIRT